MAFTVKSSVDARVAHIEVLEDNSTTTVTFEPNGSSLADINAWLKGFSWGAIRNFTVGVTGISARTWTIDVYMADRVTKAFSVATLATDTAFSVGANGSIDASGNQYPRIHPGKIVVTLSATGTGGTVTLQVEKP